MQEKIPQDCRRGYAEIDLDAVRENARCMVKNLSPETKMLAVIKTNGYGHGSVPVAKALEPLEFMFGFAIATFEEAVELQEAGITKPLLILGHTFPYAYEAMAEREIRGAVFRKDTLPLLDAAGRKTGKPVKVHIKVDTGMSRIGITPDEEGLAFVRELASYAGIEIEGIFTHFARADEKDKTYAEAQLSRFREFIQKIEEELGLEIPVKHCANSAGIVELPEAKMDAVRAGVVLYGLVPSEEVAEDFSMLRPAMSLYSEIVYCKIIHRGQSVSYGGTFTAETDMRVATVPLGYGDGYPRSLSGKGYVLIRGKKAPILGRICMDQFMVDVTDIPDATEGDRVTLLGCDGAEQITAELLGKLSGRFNYELVCDISLRIPRLYKES